MEVHLTPARSRTTRLWDPVGRGMAFAAAAFVVLLTLGITLFIVSKGLATFWGTGITLQNFFGTEWRPDRAAAEGGPQVGSLVFLTGSILVSGLAVLLSAPLSIAGAIFMTQIAPRVGHRLLQPAIEVFVGIPSVVYGWVGLSVLVPFIRHWFGGIGFSVLAGGLVLAVMVLPTIASFAADSLRRLPPDLKEAALALGATRWQTIWSVLLPAALPGILTGVVLALARAFGEALAVQMVIGNTRAFPRSLLSPTSTLTSAITADMGNTVMGSTWNNALWTMALLLLIMTFLSIMVIRRLGRRSHGIR